MRAPATVALALLLLLPSVRPEPDTPRDHDGLSWTTPPGDEARVHLDVVLLRDGPAHRLFAWFGVWRDCDGDGRVGNATTGRVTYPAASLPPGSPCRAPPHLESGTAREMAWLTPALDPHARVFADLSLPDGPAHRAPKTGPDLVLRHRAAPLALDPAGPSGALCAEAACEGWWSEPFLWAPPETPFRARHVTAYGLVGAAWLSASSARLPPVAAAYGADACEARAEGWVCDPDAWRGEVPLFATHRLRDVDDASLARPPEGTERDDDADRVGDAWNATWRVVDAATDLDGDGAPALTEFRWGTIPHALLPHEAERALDFDEDGWRDGPEIAYWDARDDGPRHAHASAMGLAVTDQDAASDVDGDGAPDHKDPDADGDGLLDGDEVANGTFPDHVDSDCAAAARRCPGPEASRRGEPREDGAGSGDGMPDAEESAFWRGRGASPDCDGDGVPNLRDADSDDDGLLDGDERGALDPCDADTDDDGLVDGHEVATDPLDADTDDDRMPDGWETRHALRPTDPRDAHEDADADGLTNAEEHDSGSDPRRIDTDLDALDDRRERELGTHPARWDTDADGMPDGWEVAHGLDPLADDADEDPDGDAFDEDGDGWPEYVHANLDEYAYARPYGWREEVAGPWTGGTLPREPDSDADGAGDGAEVAHGTNARRNVTAPGETTHRDPDFDGLSTTEELALGTKPLRGDTDEDGLCDGGAGAACESPCGVPVGERDVGANPLLADSDDDGLLDGRETCLGASPLRPDTDGDGLADAEEVAAGTAPGDADTDDDGLTDGEERAWEHEGRRTSPLDPDADSDGATDGEELLRMGTHPLLPDSDGDGLRDGDERAHRASPLHEDTDGDGMPDGWEAMHGLDPARDDADEDLDRDAGVTGLTNLQEHRLGTRPDRADTDGDRLHDHAEALLGLDPLADDARLDADADGLLNAHEYVAGTLPSRADTDEDGLTDGWEAGDPALAALGLFVSAPNATDTDRDGVDDGREVARWDAIAPGAWRVDHDGDGGVVEPLANNLRDADSDNDGLDDGQEMLALHTRPDLPDTDGDGATDRDEVMAFATDPRDAASRPHAAPAFRLDTDHDGLSDDAEAAYGTDPRDPDTDRDDMPDGVERLAWGVDWATPYDDDGRASNLVDPDADGDGIPDGIEFASAGLPRRSHYVTSPRDADTDGDGLLDGEEDDNGLVGRQAAQARGSPPPPLAPLGLLWTGVDDAGPYVEGAFGQRLYPGPPSSDGGGSGRAQPRRSSPDATDTDGDLLGDRTEQQRGTSWADRDSDGDGITDFLEPHADPDGDGLPNGLDPDADNDGLDDGHEDRNRNGRAERGETDAHDADTDDDGLCDGDEPRSDPLSPDTDRDGLADGHEERRAHGCATPSPQGERAWTRRDATLPHGRPAFQPWHGPAGPASPNAAGLFPVQALDFDEDGLLDGLEDWDADGLRDAGETDGALADSDGDGLADGLEVRVWGRMTMATFLQRAADRGLAAEQARAYTPGAWLETDPEDADTDDDGIPDGWDLDPNGLNPAKLQLVFDELRMFDPIDPLGDWAPEPYFSITLETAAGTTTLHTPNLPSLPITKGRPWAELRSALSTSLNTAVQVESLGEAVTASFDSGTLSYLLPQNIANWSRSGEAANGLTQARVSITLGDADARSGDMWGGRDVSDLIDIGPAKDATSYHASFAIGTSRLNGGLPGDDRKWLQAADGSSDSASWTNHMSNAHDDGRLEVRLRDFVRNEFLTSAITVKSSLNHYAAPPSGQSWGS